jgi:MoaA/NifB/PqqE/SkfB family radical SAM enzyme
VDVVRHGPKKRILLKRRLAKFALSLKYVLRWHKPILLFRVLKNYLYCLVSGKARLRYVDLAVTFRCNLSCIHCSASRMTDASRREMTVEDYRKLGRQLADNGVVVIQLTGGEPLVRPDLEEIIAVLGPSRFFISMGTNARLVTRERLLRLKRAGLDNLCISIDDWDAAEHDRWRGEKGTHAKALEAIELARDIGLRTMIFFVATHQNVRSDGFLKLIEYAGKARCLLLVGWAVPAGNWNANDTILLTPEDLEYLESLQEKHLHVRTDFESNYLVWGCGAVKEKLYVSAYGDVVPCAFVHIALGNVIQEPLRDIRRRGLTVDWFSRYNSLCLAANDREFQTKHMTPIFSAETEPISLADAGLCPRKEEHSRGDGVVSGG